MTKPKTAALIGFPCWKVRVVISGAYLHVLSSTEPVVTKSSSVLHVDWSPIEGTEHGDTVGFIRWADVSAITWRAA